MKEHTSILDSVLKIWPILCVVFPFLFDLQLNQIRGHITHRRNHNSTICIFFLGVMLYFVGEYFEPMSYYKWAVFLYFILLFLYVFSIRSKCVFICNPILCYFNRQYEQGKITPYGKFFEKKSHWYLIGKSTKIEYLFLRERYYSFRWRFKQSLQTLEQIPECDLYEDEKDYLYSQKAVSLAMLGCNSAAWFLIDPEKCSRDPFLLSVASLLYEQEGKIDKEREAITKAKDLVISRNVGILTELQVLADYSRYLHLFESPLEALRNIFPAYKIVAKTPKNKYYRLISCNYIKILEACGSQDEEIQRVLKQLTANLPKDDKDGQIDLLNCKVQYFFARGMHKEAYDEICSAFEWQKSVFSPKELSFIKMSIFTILVNSHLCTEPFQDDFEGEFERICYLKKIDKIEICDRYFSQFEEPLSCSIRVCRPFDYLYHSICQYYREEALKDIEEIKRDLELYEVNTQQNVFRYEMNIRRFLDGGAFIQKNLNAYRDFIGILDKNGRPMDAWGLCFDLLRQANSPSNLMFRENGKIYDWATVFRSCQIMPPQKAPDGIHEIYPQVSMESWMDKMLPPPQELLAKMVIFIENRVKVLKDGEYKVFIGKNALYVAHAYMCLEDRDGAYRWFELFKSFNIPLGLLNTWEQMEFGKLGDELQRVA